jgi:hypothetical protein
MLDSFATEICDTSVNVSQNFKAEQTVCGRIKLGSFLPHMLNLLFCSGSICQRKLR